MPSDIQTGFETTFAEDASVTKASARALGTKIQVALDAVASGLTSSISSAVSRLEDNASAAGDTLGKLEALSRAHAENGANPHGTTKAQVGLANADNTKDVDKPVSTAQQAALDGKASVAALAAHAGSTTNPHGTTKAQVGLANADNTKDVDKPVSTAQQAALDGKASVAALAAHAGSTTNPHGTTKAQVGLANADNTKDVDKPVSTAQQAALDGKASVAALAAHAGSTTNPHGTTKAQVGLANADNTKDVDKPVSTAQQAALDGKASVAALAAHAGSTTNPHGTTKAQVGLANADNTSDANKPVSTAQREAIVAVDQKASTALTLVEPLLDYPADASVRPGKNPALFGPNLTGAPATMAAYTRAAVAATTYGAAIACAGPFRVAPRDARAIIDDHRYRVTFGVMAGTDPDDPEGDSMQLGIRFLNGSYNTVSTRVVENKNLHMSNGMYVRSIVMSKAGVEGQEGLDIKIPATARHFREFVESFSATATRQVHILSVEDVSNATIASSDLSGFSGRIAGFENDIVNTQDMIAPRALTAVGAAFGRIDLTHLVPPLAGVDQTAAIKAAFELQRITPNSYVACKEGVEYTISDNIAIDWDGFIFRGGGMRFRQITAGRGGLLLFGNKGDVADYDLFVVPQRTPIAGSWYGVDPEQRIAAAVLFGMRCKVRNVGAYNAFTTVCFRGPPVNAAGVRLAADAPQASFDWTKNAKRYVVKDVSSEHCDMTVSGVGNCDYMEVDGLDCSDVTLTDPSVPSHAIYVTGKTIDAVNKTKGGLFVTKNLNTNDCVYGVAYKFLKMKKVIGNGWSANNAAGLALLSDVDSAVINLGDSQTVINSARWVLDPEAKVIDDQRFAIYVMGQTDAEISGGYVSSDVVAPIGDIIVRDTATAKVRGRTIQTKMPAESSFTPYRVEDASQLVLVNPVHDCAGESVALIAGTGSSKTKFMLPVVRGGTGKLVRATGTAKVVGVVFGLLVDGLGPVSTAGEVVAGTPSITIIDANTASGKLPLREAQTIQAEETTNIGSTSSGASVFKKISGAAIIKYFGSPPGATDWCILEFTSTPTLVHSANLILPNARNFPVRAGDVIVVRHFGNGVWKVIWGPMDIYLYGPYADDQAAAATTPIGRSYERSDGYIVKRRA